MNLKSFMKSNKIRRNAIASSYGYKNVENFKKSLIANKKIVKKVKNRINKSNNKDEIKTKPFSRLSKIDKKIAIAKDVIQQIKIGNFDATEGCYVDINTQKAENIFSEIAGNSLQKELDTKNSIYCKVCAKGSLLLGYFHKVNNISVEDVDDFTEIEICEKLSNIFTNGELDLMETAFEGYIVNDREEILYNTIPNDDDFDEDFSILAQEALKFYNCYPNVEERLIAIMKNIIKNKGYFLNYNPKTYKVLETA